MLRWICVTIPFSIVLAMQPHNMTDPPPNVTVESPSHEIQCGVFQCIPSLFLIKLISELQQTILFSFLQVLLACLDVFLNTSCTSSSDKNTERLFVHRPFNEHFLVPCLLLLVCDHSNNHLHVLFLPTSRPNLLDNFLQPFPHPNKFMILAFRWEFVQRSPCYHSHRKNIGQAQPATASVKQTRQRFVLSVFGADGLTSKSKRI